MGAISQTKEGRIYSFPLREVGMQVGGVQASNRIRIGMVVVAKDLVGSVEGVFHFLHLNLVMID